MASRASSVLIRGRRPPAVVFPPGPVDSLLCFEALQEIDDCRPNLGQCPLEVLRRGLLVDASLEAVSQDGRHGKQVPKGEGKGVNSAEPIYAAGHQGRTAWGCRVR